MSKVRSIRVRFIAVFVAVTTALLALFGGFSYFSTKWEIERQLAESAQALSTRLQGSLPAPLWEMNVNQAGALIDTEMAASDVSAIIVRDGSRVIVGRVRDASGKAVAAKPDDKPLGEKSVVPLQAMDAGVAKPIGTAEVYMSLERIERAKRSSIVSIVIQVVLQNLALVAVMVLVLNSFVLKPLNKVRRALEEIASGDADLTKRLSVASNDEIGDVAHWFNVFVEHLQGIVRQVAEGAEALAGAAAQMSDGSKEVARRASQQSEIVSSMAAAMEEMTVGITHVSEHSNEVRDLSVRSGNLSKQGSAAVTTLTSGMQRISDSVNSSGETVEALGRESEKISTVVNVIKEIADQTNLLALNAAIEAARAGEQGRGFAVVADEVRKLAERTTKSTIEISSTIGVVQQGIREAVERMHSGVARVEEGVNEASLAGKTISDVENCATRLVDAVGDIVNSISEQSSASTSIARQVEEIAEIADEADHAMQGVALHAEKVSDLAADLKAAVGGFKV